MADTMKQTQLFLTPSPGANPEFLATVEPHEGIPDVLDSQSLPSKVILEGYTRDSWAWKPSPGNWMESVCIAVDGRNKIPGFIQYLKERRKCAYGRFSPKAVCVVSYIQKKVESANEFTIRLCFDIAKLEACPIADKLKNTKHPTESVPSQQLHKVTKAAPGAVALSKKNAHSVTSNATEPPARARSGLLGNLLGATNRTNQHMEHSAKRKVHTPSAAVASASPNPQVESRTAAQVLNEFRQKMEEEMLDFDSCGEVVLKTKIVLSEMQSGLSDDDKAKITVDVLRYIVIEAAEECNEEWIAHKEPSEFMDECVVAVYKDGHAPEEVMEEVNRVELTEDMRGEQFAMQESMKRKQAAEEAKLYEQNFKKAIRENDEHEVAILNTNKRDRRTIEEIQLGLAEPAKKRKQ